MFYLVVTILVLSFLLDATINYLNLKNISSDIPDDFKGFYDEEKYQKSQMYLKENTRFSILQSTFSLVIVLGFLFLGGFFYIDDLVRSYTSNQILAGLMFLGGLAFLSFLINIPFQIYQTFVIEEKYGFNKTNAKTFIKDNLLGIIIGGLIGGALLCLVLWFFSSIGPYTWLYCWLVVAAIQIVLAFLAPVYIMPLFNKFTPLSEGDLKEEIKKYAAKQNFELSGVFTMDGSKRSSKANAYFTGFGKLRRVVLFDTLVEKHSLKELMAVLAHEIGHFKLKHIHKHILISILSMGLMFFLLSLFLQNPNLTTSFGFSEHSVYAGLLIFSLIYSPISELISLISLSMSRKYEFEADEFAAKTYGEPDALALALKKLSVDTFSNLHPHPLKVFFSYTHPPVIERIRKLESYSIQR